MATAVSGLERLAMRKRDCGRTGSFLSRSEKPSRDSSGKRSYVTTSKDTLYSISRKYGVKVEALMKANINPASIPPDSPEAL